jgi:hypothetical protein
LETRKVRLATLLDELAVSAAAPLAPTRMSVVAPVTFERTPFSKLVFPSM